MPGRHINDHQMRLSMQFRQTDTVAAAPAKASMSRATGHRIARNARLPSMRQASRIRRRPDPLAAVFETEIVPMLEAAPGLRPIAILEEIVRRHPDLNHQPDVATEGVVRWRFIDLQRIVANMFRIALSEGSIGLILRGRGFRHVSARPKRPKSDPAAQDLVRRRSVSV